MFQVVGGVAMPGMMPGAFHTPTHYNQFWFVCSCLWLNDLAPVLGRSDALAGMVMHGHKMKGFKGFKVSVIE